MSTSFRLPPLRQLGCGICLLILVAIFALIGVVCTPVGATQLAEAARLDPDSDFHSMRAGCSVVDVEHCWDTEVKEKKGSRRQYTCRDLYRFTFRLKSEAATKLELAPALHESERWEIKRYGMCGDGCYPRSRDPTSPNVPIPGSEWGARNCWVPQGDPDDLSDVYDCANPLCAKLRDPQDDVDDAVAEGVASLVAGIVFLVLCVALLPVAICCFRAAKQRVSVPPASFPQQQQVPAACVLPATSATAVQYGACTAQPVMQLTQPVPVPVAQPVPVVQPQMMTVTVPPTSKPGEPLLISRRAASRCRS